MIIVKENLENSLKNWKSGGDWNRSEQGTPKIRYTIGNNLVQLRRLTVTHSLVNSTSPYRLKTEKQQ